jgi:hypothetical protein
MHRAFAAGGLVFLKLTMLQTPVGIGQEILTLFAGELAIGAVPIPAESPDHHFHGSCFPLHAF